MLESVGKAWHTCKARLMDMRRLSRVELMLWVWGVTIAMASCFVGLMLNRLVGLGTALVIQAINVYPNAYELHFPVRIFIAFVFLLLF